MLRLYKLGLSDNSLGQLGFCGISLCWILGLSAALITSVTAEPYARPVAALDALIDLPKPAKSQLSPDQQWLLLAQPQPRPTIAQLQAELALQQGLAGISVDVQRRLQSTEPRFASFSLQSTHSSTQKYQIIAPPNSFLLAAKFSPDSRYLSYLLADAERLQLQLLDLKTGKRLPDETSPQQTLPINAVTGVWYQWASDSQSLLAPVAEPLPNELLQQTIAPIILHSDGQRQPQRTLQLLLKTKQQQQLFAALLSASVQRFDLKLKPQKLAGPLPLEHFSLSPDQQHLLLAFMPLPYSYQSRVDRFTIRRQVLHLDSGKQTELDAQPLDEGRKTRKGPRQVDWLASEPATLLWQELGSKKGVADTLWQWQPGQPKPKLLLSLAWPLEQIRSGPAQSLLLLEEKAGVERASWFDRQTGQITLWYQQHKTSAAYPGTAVLGPKNQHPATMRMFGQKVLLKRESTSRQQQLWAYDWRQPVSGQTPELVWQSQPHYREQVIAVLADRSLLLERQSPTEAPAIWRSYSSLLPLDPATTPAINSELQLSHASPLPDIWTQVTQQQVSFQRADGTALSGTLYLPKNFVRSAGPLPTLIWAYPREYESQQDLQAAIPHPLNYPVLSANNAAVMAAAGFAVFDKVTMPILANDKKRANDDYLPQLKANAEAAVAVLERLGVAKRGEIAIGGHSYGAFMVANLLAHTDLFAAGIARSGAYNRTLTPFGFQSEQRHLWQEQQLYLAMSPFLQADQIRAPLLLIHGEADHNSGTRPLQSEQMFAALRGLGKQSRLVLLPYEGHHYQAKESVRQLLAEQYQWLQQHVSKPQRQAGSVVVTR